MFNFADGQTPVNPQPRIDWAGLYRLSTGLPPLVDGFYRTPYVRWLEDRLTNNSRAADSILAPLDCVFEALGRMYHI
jgi:hypothetical protein